MTISRQLIATVFILCVSLNAQALNTDLVHVRLKDLLDRPEDGYCLDILGTGSNLRLQLPLFAHNCKSRATPDSTVTYTEQGQLLFPAAGVCVTVFGVNGTVLPGTSVLLRPCDFRVPFFDSPKLQKFDYLKNGQLQLRGYELCLAVGEESSSTYSPADRWRVLSMQSCSGIALNFSSWEMIPL